MRTYKVKLSDADLDLVAKKIAEAASSETDALFVQVTASVYTQDPRRETTMPVGGPQRIAPDRLHEMHAALRAGNVRGAARELLDAFIRAYWPGHESADGVIGNITWISIEPVRSHAPDH